SGPGRRCHWPPGPGPTQPAKASRQTPPPSSPERHFPLTNSSLEPIDAPEEKFLREFIEVLRNSRASLARMARKPFQASRPELVPAQGFEPWTIGLKDRCSNQAELRRPKGIVAVTNL